MLLEKMKIVFGKIKDIIIFFLVVASVLATSFPMWFYAYKDYGYLYKISLIFVYTFMVIGVIYVSFKVDNYKQKNEGIWYEKREKIDKKWFFRLMSFGILFWLSNVLQGLIVLYLNLDTPLNQVAIESELENFPIKSWLYLHLVLVGPFLEELAFRKVFMDLFFSKDSFIYNFLAVIFSGMIFGFLHEPTLSWFFLLYSMSGWVLALIYRYSKDIRLPIGIHIANNLISVLTQFLV